MNRILTDRRTSLLIVIVCFVTYTLIGFSRSAYTAAIAGIIDAGIFTKTAAGTINSSFYITYSITQILGSFYVDKISPFKIIALGLIGTIIANVIMGLYASYSVIFIARSFTGIVQFGIWPALLRIITEYICPDLRAKSKYFMPLGISTGSILSFLIASIVLKYGNWQNLFTVTYVSLGVITMVFFITVAYAEKKAQPVILQVKENVKLTSEEASKKSNISTWKMVLSSGAVFIFVFAFMNSLVGAGIESWMPTLIMESYDLSASFSSILTTVATCSNLVGVFWVVLFYPRVVRNEVTAVGLFFLMSLPMVIVMTFVGKIPLVMTVGLIIFVNMFKSAVHQFNTVEIPTGYKKYNKAGMMAGLINVAACVGSMVAGTIYGYTADEYGWSATILLWAVFIFIGMVASFIATPFWKNYKK
ncbi:MAG: MFS transporter [Lachnospiraceae bacterium]|nr:MFS transporter [Lachnospiraceae bacterium]